MPKRRPGARSRGRYAVTSSAIHRHRFTLATAPLVTALVVGTGIVTTGADWSEAPDTAPRATLASSSLLTPWAAISSASIQDRTLGTSRSTVRVPLVNHRVPRAKGKLWTTGDLSLRIEPRPKSRVAGLLPEDRQVPVTGRRIGAFAEVIVNRVPRWVTAEYLSKHKEVAAPVVGASQTPGASGSSGASGASGAGRQAPAAPGLSNQPCSDGSAIEASLQAAAVKVYRAACAAFPELSSYGGQDGHGEHVNGAAIDFMVPSSSVGQRLADFLYAHRAELDLFDIIWAQRIWTTQRSSEGFRSMSDRGSATANHYDHVHIMVN